MEVLADGGGGYKFWGMEVPYISAFCTVDTQDSAELTTSERFSRMFVVVRMPLSDDATESVGL